MEDRKGRTDELSYHKAFFDLFIQKNVDGVEFGESRLEVVAGVQIVWKNLYAWMETMCEVIDKKEIAQTVWMVLQSFG